MNKAAAAIAISLFVAGAALGQEAPIKLGPKDGLRFKSTNLLRVSYGAPAPDFSLRAADGRIVTLSDFRGKKVVILAFYMGLG